MSWMHIVLQIFAYFNIMTGKYLRILQSILKVFDESVCLKKYEKVILKQVTCNYIHI